MVDDGELDVRVAVKDLSHLVERGSDLGVEGRGYSGEEGGGRGDGDGDGDGDGEGAEELIVALDCVYDGAIGQVEVQDAIALRGLSGERGGDFVEGGGVEDSRDCSGCVHDWDDVKWVRCDEVGDGCAALPCAERLLRNETKCGGISAPPRA